MLQSALVCKGERTTGRQIAEISRELGSTLGNWTAATGLAEHPAVVAGGRAVGRPMRRSSTPTEGRWSSLEAVELANLAAPMLALVIQQAHRGIERVRRTPHLAYSFLPHAGLSVA